MTSPFENLSGPLGEYEGDLNVDERIVNDLITACQAVAARVDALNAIAE